MFIQPLSLISKRDIMQTTAFGILNQIVTPLNECHAYVGESVRYTLGSYTLSKLLTDVCIGLSYRHLLAHNNLLTTDNQQQYACDFRDRLEVQLVTVYVNYVFMRGAWCVVVPSKKRGASDSGLLTQGMRRCPSCTFYRQNFVVSLSPRYTDCVMVSHDVCSNQTDMHCTSAQHDI